MTKEEFIENCIVDSNGNHIKLNDTQKEFLDFDEWLKQKGVTKDIIYLKARSVNNGGGNFIGFLYQQYLEEKENKS